MKLKNAFIITCFFTALTSFKEDKKCKTTFTICDCADAPVTGATITVERCSDKRQFSTTTDSKGQGSFSLCKNEICKTKVTFIGYDPKELPRVGDNCKENNCVIKICSE